MNKKEYTLPDGRTVVFWYDEDQLGKISLEAMDMLMSMVAEKWIPCSERFPEDVEIGEEYPTVIFCTEDDVYVGFYEYCIYGNKWWTTEDYTVSHVTAWMPLPEPYKGDNE